MADAVAEHTEHSDPRIKLGPFRVDPRTIIYGTIILLASYAVFDDPSPEFTLEIFLEFAAITFIPLFAIAMAHMFSEALDIQIRYKRRLTRPERRVLLKTNLQFVYIGIVALLLGLIPLYFGWGPNDTDALLFLAGLVSLAFWGWFAATQAGLSWPRRLLFAFNYFMIGFAIVIVKLLVSH